MLIFIVGLLKFIANNDMSNTNLPIEQAYTTYYSALDGIQVQNFLLCLIADHNELMIKQLIAHGYINICNINNQFLRKQGNVKVEETALTIAIQVNNAGVIRALFNSGMIDDTLNQREELLFWAVKNQDQEIIDQIIDQFSQASKNAALFSAVQQGSLDLVGFLLSHDAFAITKKSDDSESFDVILDCVDGALIEAAKRDRLDIVKALLESGKILDEEFQKNVAIYSAAYKGNKKVVEYLLEKEADINFIYIYHVYVDTPLIAATSGGHIGVVQTLLKYTHKIRDVNQLSESLFIAVGNNRADIVELLVDKGADVNYLSMLSGKNGYATLSISDRIVTPVVLAVIKDSIDMVKMLFKSGKVSQQNKEEALFFAYKKGHEEIKKYLLEEENLVAEPYYFLVTPIVKAVLNENVYAVKQMLNRNIISANEKEAAFCTAFSMHNYDLADLLWDFPGEPDLERGSRFFFKLNPAVEHGEDLRRIARKSSQKEKDKALSIAILMEGKHCAGDVEVLIKEGAKVNLMNIDNSCLLPGSVGYEFVIDKNLKTALARSDILSVVENYEIENDMSYLLSLKDLYSFYPFYPLSPLMAAISAEKDTRDMDSVLYKYEKDTYELVNMMLKSTYMSSEQKNIGLYFAVYERNVRCVEQLLEFDIKEMHNPVMGDTPIVLAAKHCCNNFSEESSLKIIKLLLRSKNIDIEQKKLALQTLENFHKHSITKQKEKIVREASSVLEESIQQSDSFEEHENFMTETESAKIEDDESDYEPPKKKPKIDHSEEITHTNENGSTATTESMMDVDSGVSHNNGPPNEATASHKDTHDDDDSVELSSIIINADRKPCPVEIVIDDDNDDDGDFPTSQHPALWYKEENNLGKELYRFIAEHNQHISETLENQSKKVIVSLEIFPLSHNDNTTSYEETCVEHAQSNISSEFHDNLVYTEKDSQEVAKIEILPSTQHETSNHLVIIAGQTSILAQ